MDTNIRSNPNDAKMEINSDEDVFDQKQSSCMLFPSAQKEEKLKIQNQPLFPCASLSADAIPISRKTDLSWLSNKSYTDDTEKKLISFQQELQQYQDKHSDLSHNEEESSFEKDEQKSVHSKRQYSSSDEGSGNNKDYKKKKKKKHKKKHKKEKLEDREVRDRTSQTEKKHEVFSRSKIFLEGDSYHASAYRLDRGSDQNSWTYGSLYKPHIAKYKHFSPVCLGSSLSKQVLLYDVKKASKHKPWHDRYFGKENRTFIKSFGEPVICDSKKNDSSCKNYIEIEFSQELDRQANDVRQRILDEPTSAYVRGEMIKESKTLADTESIKGPLERKIEEFNKKLREDPSDIELWLNFMKFQDTVFLEGGFGKSLDYKEGDKIKRGSQALLDKKLSILDKAFEANPASVQLHLAKLELCSEFWEPAKINKELEQLLFVHPANITLWNYYLRFNQSRLSLFTVSRVTKLYHKCFKTLFSILEGKVQTHSIPNNLCSEVFEIFIRYCLFLKETDFKERALTTVQAMLEFNLFCPPTLEGASRETKMAALEEFWDSGCSKLGFPGAKGWKYWAQHKEQTSGHRLPSSENLEELEENIIEQKLSKCESWLQIEAIREAYHWLPWQPDMSQGQTEEDCEDPERLVMFDDVCPVLFTLPANLHFQLVNLLLILSGMNLKNCRLVPVKSFCENCIHNHPALLDTNTILNLPYFIKNYKPVSKMLDQFITVSLEQVLKAFKGQDKTVLTLVLVEFHLQKLYHSKAELSKSDKKELRKIVKNLLKEEHNRNNLIIWSAYVSVERLIGKPGEADAILETALAMHSGKDISVISEDTVGLLSLYRTYCEIILKFKTKDTTALWERQGGISKEVKQHVIQILYCLVEGKKYASNKLETLSATSHLKLRSKFKKLMEAAVTKLTISEDTLVNKVLEGRSVEHFYLLELCICFGLFEYCSSGLGSGQSVYQTTRCLLHMTEGRESSQLDVELYRAEIRLVLYHMASVSTPLSVLRGCLDTALSQHPNESDFLRLFADVEKRSRMTGRLHRCFDKLTRNPTSPIPTIVAVASQIEYLERIKVDSGESEAGTSRSGIINKTRSWLERSLATPHVQHCTLLWRLYFFLEKQYGDTSRLKGIFYRSIQQCPWVKELYLDGVRMFEDQLQELVDMMIEKEIRVQIPVEELDILIKD